jgi:cyclic pyranopterin phosphate synthase
LRFLHAAGIRKIRFTGGEPTMYKRLTELVSDVKAMDEKVHTAITTNGVLLADMANPLATAGLDSLNISLDTLKPAKFRALTGTDHLQCVIAGIDAAIKYIGNVKLNTVIMKGVNDDEAEQLITFSAERGLNIRFIEFMPNRYSAPGDARYISNEEIRHSLPWDLKVIPTDPGSAARYFSVPDLNNKIGFISPVSHPFCSGCNRIRLTADGLLYSCLYDSSNINLFELLASGSGKAKIELNKLLKSKQYGGHHDTCPSVVNLPSFSAIGG